MIYKETIGRIVDDYVTKIEELTDKLEHKGKDHKIRWNIFVIDFVQVSKINKINDESERLYYVQNIQLYTYEVVNQDRTIYLEGEPEKIINDLFNN
ncbi:hypothetical protein U3516DRAFT_734821 [Neocallimastix sp. 'constans']